MVDSETLVIDCLPPSVTSESWKDGKVNWKITSSKPYEDAEPVENPGCILGAPVVRSNPIPGQSDRNHYDPATGEEFHSRSDYEQYRKERGLEDIEARAVPEPPSEAQLPKRPAGQTTYGMLKPYRFNDPDGSSLAGVPVERGKQELAAPEWQGSNKQKNRIAELQRLRAKRNK